MRVLVTGGSGRLGRSVVRGLTDAGNSVVSVDIEPDPTSPAEQHIVDLTDAGSTRRVFAHCRPEAIVHLAAIAVPFSLPDAEIFATNTAILYHVLDAAVAVGAGALLVASSPTVIGYGNPHGWVPRGLPIDETHPLEPWHGYAVSKVAMEQIVAMAVRSQPQTRFGVFRPCYVITPEEWRGAPTQQGHTVAARLDDPALSAVALFNYVDARDAAEFVDAWLTAGAPSGTTFFVGAADALAREPVPELVARHLPALAAFAEHLGPHQALFDTTRARDLLGWTPRRSWRTELDDQ